MSDATTYDAFVCHASEDKLRFVDPLLHELDGRGVKFWYDRVEIKLGGNIAARINDGLARSRFGVVVLSPRFWKYWTGEELGALHALEALDPEHRRRIIPVCFEVDHVDVAAKAPLLVGRLGIPAGLGVDEVARRIAESVGPTAGVLAPLAPGLGRARIYNLPERPRAQVFVGRDQDMATLAGLLAPGADVGVAAAVEGLFGVGKTEVALQLAHRLAMTDRFPGGIFWLDGSQTDLTPQWGGRIADEKRIGQGPQAERGQAVLGEINSCGAALVILDNVEAWSSADAPKPLPHGAQIARLVTTRARDLGGSSFKHVTLGVLSAKDSRELLLSLAGAARDGEVGLDGLLVYLDGLALAIELAGAYLRKFPTVTVAEYLAQLEAGAPVEDKVVDKVRYEATVRAAFDATYAKLDDASRRALRVCVCFADADASIALLRECGVDLDAETALRDVHLIAGCATRWSMHRLARASARRTASAEVSAEAERAFVQGCAKRVDGVTVDNGHAVYYVDGPHLERALATIDAASAAPQRHMLLHGFATAAQSAGALANARDTYQRLLDDAIKCFGVHHANVATSRNNLAMVLREFGALTEAQEMLALALASDVRHFGERSLKVAIGRMNLGLVLKDRSMPIEAREFLEAALATLLDLSPGDARLIAVARSDLGLVLTELGELPRAEELLREALRADLTRTGPESLIVAKRKQNLALVLARRGDLDGAQTLQENALAIQLEHLGKMHPAVAIARSNLASTCFNRGDAMRARALLEEALASELVTLGEDHPNIAIRRSNLAAVLTELKEYQRGLTIADLALAAALKCHGRDHVLIAHQRTNRAILLAWLKRPDEARGEVREALRIVSTLPADAYHRINVERVAGQLGMDVAPGAKMRK